MTSSLVWPLEAAAAGWLLSDRAGENFGWLYDGTHLWPSDI
jgi:hypothetical protein